MPTTQRVPVADGESVAVVHHEAPADDWLFFCHGFLSDKSGSYETRCERAVEEGYNAVRFDFRGCGESDGAFVDQTLTAKLADLEAVVDHFDPREYVLFGSSFGGKVAFHTAATDERVTAVVTRAPVTSNEAFEDYRAIVEREGAVELDTGVSIDERFFEDFDRYPFEDVSERLCCPVAILHGADDVVVPIAGSFDAAAALDTHVCLEKFAGEGHRFSRAAEATLRQRVFDWLDSR